MVLNYYIATQTVEEHLRFVFVTFFYHWFFLLFLKNKMQHIPEQPRLVGQGLKMLDMVPALQTTGSYHRQDWFIYSGNEPAGSGSGGVRRRVRRLRFPIAFSGEKKSFKGL